MEIMEAGDCKHRWTYLGNGTEWTYCSICRLSLEEYIKIREQKSYQAGIEDCIKEIPDNFGYWIDSKIQKPIILEGLKQSLREKLIK